MLMGARSLGTFSNDSWLLKHCYVEGSWEPGGYLKSLEAPEHFNHSPLLKIPITHGF
jgi:hypothetical protein